MLASTIIILYMGSFVDVYIPLECAFTSVTRAYAISVKHTFWRDTTSLYPLLSCRGAQTEVWGITLLSYEYVWVWNWYE